MSLIGIKAGRTSGVGKAPSPASMLRRRLAESTEVDPETLTPAWEALSDYYTDLAEKRSGRMDIQVTVAPKAGAGNPGFFVPKTARINVEGDLIPVEPDHLNPSDPEHFAAMAEMHGVFIHEVGHAKHSGPMEKIKGPGAKAMTVLEEIRMESRVVEARPDDADWLRAAADKILLREDVSPPPTKAGAAMSATLTLGRVHAGSLEESDVEPVVKALEGIFTEDELKNLHDIWSEAVDIEDGDDEGLLNLGERMAAAFPDDEEVDGDAMGELGDAMGEAASSAAGGGREGLEESGAGEDTMEDIADDVEDSVGTKTEAVSSVAEKTEDPAMPSSSGGHGFGESGRRVTFSERDPRTDERAQRNKLSAMLRKARWRDRAMRKVATELPPGRLRSREAVRASAEKSAGRMPTAKPWAHKKRIHVDQPRVKCAVMVDVSGSMASFTAGIASSLWVLSNAVRDAEGTVCGIAFGDAASIVAPHEKPLKKVMEFPANAGSEAIGSAFDLAEMELGLSHHDGPALVIIVSDGHWVDYREAQRADEYFKALRAKGVKIVQVGIERAAVDHGADRNVVLKKPEDLGPVVGAACIEALRGVPKPLEVADA